MGAGVEYGVGKSWPVGLRAGRGDLDRALLPGNGRICSRGPSVSKPQTPNWLQCPPAGQAVWPGGRGRGGNTVAQPRGHVNISVVIFHVSKLRPREAVTASTSQVRPRGLVDLSCMRAGAIARALRRPRSRLALQKGLSAYLSLPSSLPLPRGCQAPRCVDVCSSG